MIDSGSQSSAVAPSFAPEYGTDDTERARLWCIQDKEIAAHGKKVVNVKFGNETGAIDASLKVDVSDVKRNAISMGRLVRSGFDLHFTECGRECWMEKDGVRVKVHEDDPRSDAPFYHLSWRLCRRRGPGQMHGRGRRCCRRLH